MTQPGLVRGFSRSCAAALLLAAGPAWADFTESFTSNAYEDIAQTSAVWDTSAEEVHLPSDYTFAQPSGVIVWGGQINTLKQNAGQWLIGGNGAKLNHYNGSSFVSLSNDLKNFSGNSIFTVNYGNGYWLVGGGSQKLNKYDGSEFTDYSSSLSNWSGADVRALTYGAGSDNFWLIVGSNGKLNRYNGTSFADLSGSAGFWGSTTTGYAAAFNGTYWLLGGSNGYLVRYQSGTFTPLSAWGSGIVYAIAWDSANSQWLIGGSGGRLLSYNGTSFVNQSSKVSTFNNIYNIAHNGSYWLLVGNDTTGASEAYSMSNDFANTYDLSSSLSGMGSQVALYAVDGDGTEWLLGGVEAKLNDHTGGLSSTTFSDRAGDLVEFGIDNIYAAGYNSTDGYWLFGGANKNLNRYSSGAFTDISSNLSGWSSTQAVTAVGYNAAGNYWLIGGADGRLNRYNGTSCTDLTGSLGFGTGVAVNAIRWNGSLWLIGGDNAKLSSYDGSSFASLTLNNFNPLGTNESVRAIEACGGYWLIGGTNGCANRYNGTSFSDLRANLQTAWSGYYNVNSISQDGTSFWLGGNSGHVASYLPMVNLFTDYSGTDLSTVFGSNNVLSVYWSTGFNCLIAGGQNAKLAFLYLPSTVADHSDDLIKFSPNNINQIAFGLDTYFIVGAAAAMNTYGPLYDQPKWAQSLIVAESTEFFYSVTLTASDDIPTGTNIHYYLTANGQLADPQDPDTWIEVTPGVATIFTGIYAGMRLKWKAELTTDNLNLSPRIYQINLQFQIPPTPTPTGTFTATPTVTATPSATPSETSTATPTCTITPTDTATFTRTPTSTATPTSTISPTSTDTPTISPTPTEVIFSPTITPTPTQTMTYTLTPTYTQTPTITPTFTETSTLTPTYSVTLTMTITPTPTETPLVSPTPTPTASVTETWTASPTATPNPAFTFYNGSLIIPMDTASGRTNQDRGMWRAYGLVYRLLQNGIPVHWAIKSYKDYEEIDFTCTQTKDIRTSANYTNPSYNGGPFVIEAANSTAAVAIITTWNTGQTNIVQVHQYTDSNQPFNAPIFRKLKAAPKIAIYDNSDPRDTWTSARNYLNAAAIRDTNGNNWPSTSPDVLDENEIAGPTTSSHTDGALFLSGSGLPAYAMLINMHWQAYPIGVPNSGSLDTITYGADYSISGYEGRGPSTGPGHTGAGSYGGGWDSGGEVYQNVTARANVIEASAEMDYYLRHGTGHVYAQCIGVAALENNIIATSPYWNDFVYGGYGHWLTTNGVIDTSTLPGSTAADYLNNLPDAPAGQATGNWTYMPSSSQAAFGLAPGSTFYGGESSLIVIDSVSPGSYPYLFMNGHYKGITGAGKASYLVGHDSSYSLPYSTNSRAPMMRYFYNSLFESPAASEAVPEIYLEKTGPSEAEIGMNLTYTITYHNVSGVAYTVTLTDPYPANTTYVSNTGGGVPGAGRVTWTLGTLAPGASGSVTVTYSLQNPAPQTGWTDQASTTYYSGPTQFTRYSNVVTTLAVVFTPTPTVTSTRTITPTSTHSPTATSSATASSTATPTESPTATPTESETATETPTDTPTATISPTATITPTATATPTITPTSTISPTATNSPEVTATPTDTATATSTATPTYTISPTVTMTPTSSFTATRTPTDTSTRTVTSTPSATVTATPTGTATMTPTQTVSPTITETATAVLSPTFTITPTFAPPTATPTVQPATAATATPTPTSTATPIPAGAEIRVYPNPFNPGKAFGGTLKLENVPSGAEVKIFTVSGELVRTFDGNGQRLTWDGTNKAGEPVVAGVYLYIVTYIDDTRNLGKIFLVR